MADMLVKLYNLPPLAQALQTMHALNIEIIRDQSQNKRTVTEWVGKHFNASWADGVAAAYENRPVTNWIAVEPQSKAGPPASAYDLPGLLLVGFACYDAGTKGIFGPIGVREDYRNRAIGMALLLACLHGMADDGYAYAVIHWAGPVEWYERTVGAVLIPDSEPAFYRGPIILEKRGQ